MTKRKTKPVGAHGVRPLDDRPCPPDLYEQALAALQITVPVYTCRVIGNRLEFRLYGGRVLHWEVPHAD